MTHLLASNWIGLRYALVECRRRGLYHVSMYSKMAVGASARVFQTRSGFNSTLIDAKKLSTTALSQQSPLRLILAVMPFARRKLAYARQAYWLPRSLCSSSPL